MHQSILRKGVLFLLVLSFLFVGCGDDDKPTNPLDNVFAAEETFSFKVEAGDLTRINISAVSGAITIVGEAGLDSASISGTKRVESTSTEDAEERLEQLSVNVEEIGGGLYVSTVQPSDTEGREYTVDYVIRIPVDIVVHCFQVAGIVTVRDMEAAVAVDNTSGQIILDGVSGSTEMSVTAGQIIGSASVPEGGTMAMNVTSGSITLGIPQNTSASFLATVTTGTVTVANLVLSDEVVTTTRVSGTLGDGQGEITLSVTAGNIVVTGE